MDKCLFKLLNLFIENLNIRELYIFFKFNILAILEPKFIMIPNKMKLKSILFRKAENVN